MHKLFFLSSLSIGTLVTFVYSIITSQPKYAFNKRLVTMLITTCITAVIVGKFTGNYVSHGFDIPEWGFSFIFFVLCLAAYFFGNILIRLINRLRNTNKL